MFREREKKNAEICNANARAMKANGEARNLFMDEKNIQWIFLRFAKKQASKRAQRSGQTIKIDQMI